MDGNLPWILVFLGVFLAVVVELVGVSALPVAIGLYLPLELSACIMIGGLIRLYVDRKKQKEMVNRGILFCSGMIAGEGLVGILLALLAVANLSGFLDISGIVHTGTVGGIVLLAGITLLVVVASVCIKKEKEN